MLKSRRSSCNNSIDNGSSWAFWAAQSTSIVDNIVSVRIPSRIPSVAHPARRRANEHRRHCKAHGGGDAFQEENDESLVVV